MREASSAAGARRHSRWRSCWINCRNALNQSSTPEKSLARWNAASILKQWQIKIGLPQVVALARQRETQLREDLATDSAASAGSGLDLCGPRGAGATNMPKTLDRPRR